MHILIALITAIAGLIWALNSLQRSGLDLNAFNPFTWLRRRQWEKRYNVKPLYNLDKPIDAASVILVGLLKLDGELLKESQDALINIFINEFNMTEEKAKEIFQASAFMLNDELDFTQSIRLILQPVKEKYSSSQIQSLLTLSEKVCTLNGLANNEQLLALKALQKQFPNQ